MLCTICGEEALCLQCVNAELVSIASGEDCFADPFNQTIRVETTLSEHACRCEDGQDELQHVAGITSVRARVYHPQHAPCY